MPTYQAPPSKTSGDPTLAADWNNYVRDNFGALRDLLPNPTASNLPLVSVSTSTAAFGQVGAAGIASGAVTSDKLATGAAAANLADNSVGRKKLAAVAQHPIGAVTAFAGGTAPAGWLLCHGQEVSTTTYNELHQVLLTTYGTASAGNFRLPDLRGRFPLGVSGTYLRGGTGGAATKAIAGHTHTTLAHSHTGPSHSHSFSVNTDPESEEISAGGSTTVMDEYGTAPTDSVADTDHTHKVKITYTSTTGSGGSGSTGNASPSTDTGGAIAAQDVLNPYLALNYIIYAGV